MLNKGLSQIGLRLLDRATDAFPASVPKFFNRAFIGLLGSRPIAQMTLKKYRKRWDRIAEGLSPHSKILLIVDVCIGDTVLASECLPVLQEAFPNSEVHFVCNRTGGELIDGMLGIHVHNIFEGARGFPTNGDLVRLRSLLTNERFDAMFNLGPFLDPKALPDGSPLIQLFVPFAAHMLIRWKSDEHRHISYCARTFLREFLGVDAGPSHNVTLNTNTVYLSRESLELAHAFLDAQGLLDAKGLVLFNADATSAYGQMPFDVQLSVLRHLCAMREISNVLIGKAYTAKGIEQKLLAELPEEFHAKIVIVPHVPIEVYTALIDASDMFISGDTGPLHIAACRKQGPKELPSMRNRTAVLAIYGATDSKMYGYDSEQAYHVPANQDAPSRSFSAPAPCRNISCINKFGKSCHEVRCFHELPLDGIFAHIDSFFQGRAEPPPVTIALTAKREYAI